MKHMSTPRFGVFAAGLSFLAFFAPSLLGAVIPVDSKVTAVTVYTDRAQVTRSASVELPSSGIAELVFENLPEPVQSQSLQVTGKGTAKFIILDVNAQTKHLEATPHENFNALTEELRGLEKQKRGLTDKLKGIDMQKGYLNMIRVATTQPQTEGQTRPTPEEWTQQLSFQAQVNEALDLEQQKIDQAKETLEAKIEAVRKQLEELVGASGRTVKQVLVRVNAEAAGQFQLSLAYQIGGANWQPTYDARITTGERSLQLGYKALVRNGTGEDWDNVKMILSTARPSLGGSAPELSPWFVDVLALNQVRRQKTAFAMAEMAPAAARASEDKKLDVFALEASATVDSSLSSASFQVATPVSLKADNSAQKIPITQAVLPAALEYRATPKLQETAFLGAKMTNNTEFPLLAGAVSVFLDDRFVATSQLKTVMPSESFDLALGADEGISLKRRLVNRFVENTGLTSKGKRTTYDILVTVTNNKRSAEKLILAEPIPVSRHEKIEVKLLTPLEREIGTAEAPREISREEESKLVWRLELKPGEKREIPLKFQIEHPADLMVTGVE